MELVLQKKFVSEDVWERGLEDGLGLLYHGALSKFPMEFSSFLQYSIAMATAGEQSARNVSTLFSYVAYSAAAASSKNFVSTCVLISQWSVIKVKIFSLKDLWRLALVFFFF